MKIFLKIWAFLSVACFIIGAVSAMFIGPKIAAYMMFVGFASFMCAFVFAVLFSTKENNLMDI